MSNILPFPIHHRRHNILLRLRLKELKARLEMLKHNLLWNLGAQKLYCKMQDEISEIERALSQ